MDVLTPWSYLYLIFILPPLLLFSLILKDRMSTAALPASRSGIKHRRGTAEHRR